MSLSSFKAMQADPAMFRAALFIPTADGPRKFNDVAAEFQRRDFVAIDAALQALAKGEKPAPSRLWIERTKGASKDSDLAVAILWLVGFCKRSITAQIGAADQDQADELRKAAKSILRLNPWLGDLVEIRASSILNPRTESKADIIPADAAGSHGSRPDVVILNELTHIVGDQGKEFAATLLDNASKMPSGVAIIATNAGHLGTWQYEWRENARTDDYWYFSKFDYVAPWLDAREIEQARKRNSPARFDRLWRGVWSADSGNALAADDLAAAVTLAGPMEGRDERLDYFAGVDLGISHDATAVAVVGRERPGERLKLAHLQAWLPVGGARVSLECVESDLLALDRRFRFAGVRIDPWQAALLCERLRRRGVAVEEYPFTSKNLGTMATATVQAFSERRLALFDDATLLADLRRLRIVEKGYGVRLEASRDASGHADRATALALALAAAHEGMRYSEIRVIDPRAPEWRDVPTVAELLGEPDDPFRFAERIEFDNWGRV